MALVLTQEGAVHLWRWWLQVTAPSTPLLHLLGSAFFPLHTSMEADFAGAELAGGGYAPLAIPSGLAWSIAPIPQGASATQTVGPWALTLPVLIYGYWLSDSLSTYSLWGEAFSPPFSFNPLGGPLFLTLLPQLISIP